MNLAILVVEVILIYFTIIIIYRKTGKIGIYFWCIIATILANIMSLKTATILEMEVSLGFALYTSIIISSNIIVQKHGPDDVTPLIIITIISSIVSYIIIYFSTKLITPIILDNNPYNYIFRGNIRPIIGNTLALLTLTTNSLLYHSVRKYQNKIYLSNILSGIITNFIITIIFVLTTSLGTNTIEEIAILIFIRYFLTMIVHILGTIPIQISSKLT